MSDIWGAVVPAWLGGVGGMAAAIVSTVALVKSVKTQGGVQTLMGAANAASSSEAPRGAQSNSSSAPRSLSPVSWTAWHESKSRYKLRNDSTRNGAAATLTGFRDVTPGGDDAAYFTGSLPIGMKANESVPFHIEKSIVSPSVTAIELTWLDEDGTERQRTLYI